MLHFAKDFNIKEQTLGYIELKGKPTPTLDLFRSNGEKLTSEKISYYEKFQVLNDGYLTAQLVAPSEGVPAITLTVNPELAKFLSKGHVICIDDEYLMVDSINTSTNVVTVGSRGYASTPVTTHSNNTKVYVISKAEADGTVTEDYKKTASVERINNLQEFTKSVEVTDRSNDLSHKDFSSLKGEETSAKLNEQGQEMNRSVLYGMPKFDPDFGRHTMGGLKYFISSGGGKILDANGSLTDDKFDFFLAQLAQRGSEVNTIICNPMAMNKVFKGLRNTIKYDKDSQGNQIAGGTIVGYMPTTMGGKQLAFLLDIDCREKDMFIINSDELYFLPLVDKNSGKDKVFLTIKETNKSSAVDSTTIKTTGTIKVVGADKMGYIANIF